MKTIHTILPVYDSLDKQDYRRTRNRLPVHCPRHRLPAMQWNVEMDTPGELNDIDLVNFNTGAVTDIRTYFCTTASYIQTGGGAGWVNNAHPSDYDTFTSVNRDITHASIAGSATIASCWNSLSVGSVPATLAIGEVIVIKATLTMEGGTTDYPKIALQNTGTLAIISNIVTLGAGVNYVALKATAALATGWAIVVYNAIGDTAHFNIVFDWGEKTVCPILYTALTNDYFQYKGGTLGTLLPYGVYYLKMTSSAGYIYYSEVFAVTDIYPNLISSFTNVSYDDWHSTGTVITHASEPGAAVEAQSTQTFSAIKGEVIHVTFFYTYVSGTYTTFQFYIGGMAASNLYTAVAGLNDVDFTFTNTGTAVLSLRNIATEFSTSEVLVIRVYSTTHIKLTFDNTKDLGDILYQDGFSQTLWLQTQLATPIHEQVDVGEEKSGIFIAEKIVNKFKFRILANMGRELYRALTRLPLHDDIDIIDEVGNTYSPAVGNIWINVLNWPGFDYVQIEIVFNDNSEIFWVSNNANFT
jgi:hypothetical protein